jgi:hypothetical protein
MTDMYAIIDDDVKTETQTAEDIIREIRNKNGKLDLEEEEEGGGGEEEEEEEEDDDDVPIHTVSEALETIRILNCFYKSRAGNSKIVSQIVDIEQHLENRYGQAAEDS